MLQHLKTVALVAFIGVQLVACRESGSNLPQSIQKDNSMPSASEIIDRMAAAYLKCNTYTDTGSVTTVFKSADGTRTVVKQFSTALVRPGQFRFEYSEVGESDSRYVVWQKGSDVRTWWDVTKEAERPSSLGLALAGATGVSSGSAHTVPALLMPEEVGGRLFTDLQELQRGEDEALGTHKCFTIEALYVDSPIKIWIDQDTFAIRRIDGTTELEGFSTVETTVYQPIIDKDVAPALLDYNAPE